MASKCAKAGNFWREGYTITDSRGFERTYAGRCNKSPPRSRSPRPRKASPPRAAPKVTSRSRKGAAPPLPARPARRAPSPRAAKPPLPARPSRRAPSPRAAKPPPEKEQRAAWSRWLYPSPEAETNTPFSSLPSSQSSAGFFY